LSRELFGTDGIRGVANKTLTAELALSVSLAAGKVIASQNHLKTVVIGRDTRTSGPMLESAMVSGFLSMGWDVIALGIVPTPCISYVTRTEGFDLGAVISASHNPAPDNGIKFFGSNGRKLDDSLEAEIESQMNTPIIDRPQGEKIGRLIQGIDLSRRYVDHLVSLGRDLNGLTLAIDAANGAAYSIAIEVFTKLGAKVISTGIEPDGININAVGGATKPNTIMDLTKNSGADLGVAFDGDADRAVFSDRQGRLINGDRTMGCWAIQKKSGGALDPLEIIGTVMSNGGFERYLLSKGITLNRAPVGDKYVSERIDLTGAKIGGEQSGHIIFPEFGPTGDGIVTAIQLINSLLTSNLSAEQVYDEFEPWPQLLLNVEIPTPKDWKSNKIVADSVSEAENLLEGKGRINVRPSGTQPVLRIMIEAETQDLRDKVEETVRSALENGALARIISRIDLTYALGD